MTGTDRPGTTPATAQPLARVVQLVKGYVERCGWIWVEAQVIELRRRSGATQYLTLRDPRAEVSAQITCTAAVLDAAGPITEGSTVLARLTPRVWPKSSELKFECAELRISGEGLLLARLEQLRRKLQAEGLFDPRRKKRLPLLPRAVGLVTGAQSAAERDVLTNLRGRWPGVVVKVRHALMQGPECAADVMRQLAALDKDPDVDVIIIARGGGSLEDLLAFSDEGLVRAVVATRTPVVSAIGHEPDTPIIDLAADLRASTPTDAAKRIVPDAAAELAGLDRARARIRGALQRRLTAEADRLATIRSRPVLASPAAMVQPHRLQVEAERERGRRVLAIRLERALDEIGPLRARARSLSPQSTLDRGYAVVSHADGAAVTDRAEVDAEEVLRVRVARGDFAVKPVTRPAAPKNSRARGRGSQSAPAAKTAKAADAAETAETAETADDANAPKAAPAVKATDRAAPSTDHSDVRAEPKEPAEPKDPAEPNDPATPTPTTPDAKA